MELKQTIKNNKGKGIILFIGSVILQYFINVDIPAQFQLIIERVIGTAVILMLLFALIIILSMINRFMK